MKNFKEVRAEDLNEDYNQNLPVVLVLKRKAIRVYPNGVKVGLYYSDKLKKYVSVPFGDDTTITDTVK